VRSVRKILLPISLADWIVDLLLAVIAIPRKGAVVVPVGWGALAECSVAASAFMTFVRLIRAVIVAICHVDLLNKPR
jgi:hypothetical protein